MSINGQERSNSGDGSKLFLLRTFAVLTKNSILRLGSSQVKIAHDVQTTKGAVVFGQQVIDKSFRSCGVYVLHHDV